MSKLRQKVSAELQQHAEAAATCQAELAKVTGVQTESHASSSGQQSRDCKTQESQHMEQEAECPAGTEADALKDTTEVSKHSVQKRRKRDTREEEEGGWLSPPACSALAIAAGIDFAFKAA